MSVLSDRQFQTQTMGPSGGASRSIHDHSAPTSGFMVGHAGGIPETTMKPSGLQVKSIRDHQARIRNTVGNANVFQGSWHDPDTGKVTLDASEQHQSQATARLRGLVRGEKAIYDLNKGQDQRLPHKASGSKVFKS